MKKLHSKYLIQSFAHLCGSITILSIVLSLNVNAEVARVFFAALDDPSFYSIVTLPLMMLAGVSACLWALIWLTGKWIVVHRRETKRLAVVRTRGAIMTEFLIVLPVYLLLTSGLAQLSVNSTAKVLTALATFQAGRTAWIWEPETRGINARNSANADDVNERARIAAAAVLAPVVPAEFRGTCSYSATFDETMRAMTLMPANMARGLVIGQVDALPQNRFYNVAFDDSVMLERGAKKLFMAYCHTRAEFEMGGRGITTRVEYDHANVFPWFAYIFGQPKVSGGRLGYYSVMTAEYSLPLQIDANPRPARSLTATFNNLIGRLGGKIKL
ncbi:MAG: hypothetical protein R3E66_22750 [bacterium]